MHFAVVYMGLSQGWEFALWFFERIARFFKAKEQFALEKEQMANGSSFLKSQSILMLFKNE